MTSLHLSMEDELNLIAKHLDLEKMYEDLAMIKGSSLTPVEKQILHLKLTGHDTETIARFLGNKPGSISVECSRGLNDYIQTMLVNDGLISQPKDTNSSPKPKANWSRFMVLLDRKYRRL